MSDAGYVRIYRTLLGHPAFRNDGEAMAFAWMVIRASWRATRVRYKGQAVALQRGQLAVSVRDLAEALDRQKGWVERLLARLKSANMLILTRAQSGTAVGTVSKTAVNVITICNYDDYQAEQDSDGTANGTGKKTGAGQRQDTEQRREKGKKEEPIGSSPPISPKAKSADAFPRPDWADPQVWSDFLANRRKKRLSNTATAYQAFLKELAKFVDEDWPPGRVLEAIVARGWGGAYDPRGNQHGNRNGSGNYANTARNGDGALDELGRRIQARRSTQPAQQDRQSDAGESGCAGELPFAPPAARRAGTA